MDWFGKIAVRLARNPLGVIALFIVLVYAISGWVFTQSAPSLNDTQKTILILFIVIFPCVILLVFYRLVANHHTKLYAPIDYRDDQAFLTAAAPSRQGDRLREELRKETENLIEEGVEGPVASDSIASDSHAGGGVIPEQRTNKEPEIGSKKTEIADLVQSAYLAETLVLQDLENELGFPINRNVRMGVAGKSMEVDGVIRRPEGAIFVEVKYLRSKSILPQLLRNVAKRIDMMTSVFQKMNLLPMKDFILAIVVHGGEEFREEVKNVLDSEDLEKIDFEVRVYSFDDLLNKYGLS